MLKIYFWLRIATVERGINLAISPSIASYIGYFNIGYEMIFNSSIKCVLTVPHDYWCNILSNVCLETSLL